MPGDPVYDEVAAFLAELARGGVRHVVLSPGSRSTPLTIAAAAQPALRHWMQLDERTAGFFALGLAKATRSPVALVCTSGTAVANYYPAVIEASRTGVPLIVLSADRPPELRGGWGSNQTIDQVEMFGRYVRSYVEMPVGGTSSADDARSAAVGVLAAVGAPQVGPVQVNWPFRKPLEPVGAVPVVDVGAVEPQATPAEGNVVAALAAAAGRRGALVVGPLDDPAWSDALCNYAQAVGWPILAEATSQLRLDRSDEAANLISFGDRIVHDSAARESLVPEVVIFAGATPTGPGFLNWAEHHDAQRILLIDPPAPWLDSGPIDATAIFCTPADLQRTVGDIAGPVDLAWLDQWKVVDRQVESVLTSVALPDACGPSVARTVASSLAGGAHLVVANSMSVRDLDRYGSPRSDVRVHASRGASGIDGQIATAAGIAAADIGPVTLLIGDIAFLHDLSSLLAAVRAGVDLTIVLVNDDGGGIFSMLPIADHGDSVRFHELFHTPHGTDLTPLGGFEGIEFVRAESAAELTQTLGGPGVKVIEVVIDHETNLEARRSIDAAISAAVSAGAA